MVADAISLPACEDAAIAHSALEAIRFAAARVLDMHVEDLQILVIGHVDRDEVDGFLWDPMPGGSGLLDQLCGRFGEVVEVARQIVEDCPALCETSCIDCLQRFRNSHYHKFLNRRVALQRLLDWGARLEFDHEIPAAQALAQREEAVLPVNEAERNLRALLNAAGFEDGERGKQLVLDRTIGTTTPDVFYRGPDHGEDEGVCIYVDGLSSHIHGNPRTAEKDRQIRDWLRNKGYEVIEIAAVELDDPGAMQRHFRRLAGYLAAPELRERVRRDTAWFTQALKGLGAPRAMLRLVRPRPEEQYVKCVPLVPLRVAAGAFGDPQAIDESDWDWVEVETARKPRKGMFVAQVVGRSMEPIIPDGSYCLFAAPLEGSRQGKIVLVQLRDQTDPETGERCTVKRYASEKVVAEDGSWRHVKITLKPTNLEFSPIELTCEDEGQVQADIEFLEVLGEFVDRE